jgi:serine protease Do
MNLLFHNLRLCVITTLMLAAAVTLMRFDSQHVALGPDGAESENAAVTANQPSPDVASPEVSLPDNGSESTMPEPTLAVTAASSARARSAASDLSAAFRAAADRALPSVVAVETGQTGTHKMTWNGEEDAVPWSPDGRSPSADKSLEGLFRQFSESKHRVPGPSPHSPRPPRSGIGSGVIIDTSGLILSNHHVIADTDSASIRLHDGRTFPVTRVWSDPPTDIAVLKIEGATGLVAATLGDSEAIAIGDWVLALGQPYGLASTVTAGIISGLHRSVGITARDNLVQTDAAINPGNSGGPLVNLAGEVIGINTAISSRDGGNDGIGFAVPSNMARWVADQLVTHGRVRRASIGIAIQPLTPEVAEQLNVNIGTGVLVAEVRSGSPAEAAGLQPGDIILRYAGADIATPQQLQILIEQTAIGETRNIEVIRDGQAIQISVTLAELPAQRGDAELKRGREKSDSPTKPGKPTL